MLEKWENVAYFSKQVLKDITFCKCKFRKDKKYIYKEWYLEQF